MDGVGSAKQKCTSDTLSVGLQATSQLATIPLDIIQEREMEVAVMELTDTNTYPGTGTGLGRYCGRGS